METAPAIRRNFQTETVSADRNTGKGPGIPGLRRVACLVDLAFLAPDIVQSIVDGRQPATLTADGLIKSRHRIMWADQRAWISAI